jgi:hypothetical protein
MRVEVLIPEHLKSMHRKGIVRYARTGHGLYIDSQELLELPAVRKGGGEIRIEMSLNLVGFPGEENEWFVLAIVRALTAKRCPPGTYERCAGSKKIKWAGVPVGPRPGSNL